jgi:hypothetical protein
MRPRPCAASAVAAAGSLSCNRESPWEELCDYAGGPVVGCRTAPCHRGSVPGTDRPVPFGLHVRQQILLVGTRDELPGRRTREASARTVEISKSVKLACTIWPANVPGPVGAADSCTKVSQIRSRQYSNARIGATAEVAPLSLRYRMAGNRNSTPAFGAAAGWRRRRATVETPLCRGVAHRYRSR